MSQKLLVLGASGRTGRLLVAQALDAGFEVRAYVRTPARLQLDHPRLEKFQGNVLDRARLASALQGVDAVLSTLGRDGRDLSPLLDGTTLIIEAMKAEGVRRLVLMSSLGAGSSRVLSGPLLDGMVWLAGLRPSFDAKGVQERALLASGLDVSIVFAGGLTDGPRTDRVRAASVAQTPRPRFMPPTISRADVAAFMLGEAHARRWSGQSVCISS